MKVERDGGDFEFPSGKRETWLRSTIGSPASVGNPAWQRRFPDAQKLLRKKSNRRHAPRSVPSPKPPPPQAQQPPEAPGRQLTLSSCFRLPVSERPPAAWKRSRRFSRTCRPILAWRLCSSSTLTPTSRVN